MNRWKKLPNRERLRSTGQPYGLPSTTLRKLTAAVAAWVCAAVTAPPVRAQLAPPARYSVTDLGIVSPLADYSYATAINDLGNVVGVSRKSSSAAAYGFLWTPAGGAQLLPGQLNDGAGFKPADINESNEVVGAHGSGIADAFGYWSPTSGFRDLGGIPGRNNNLGTAINDDGFAVGSAFYRDSEIYNFAGIGWKQGTGLRSLDQELGFNGRWLALADVNNSGSIAGHIQQNYGGSIVAVRYVPGQGLQDLSLFESGQQSTESRGHGINAGGSVVGYAVLDGKQRPFRNNGTGSYPLGPDTVTGRANAINDGGATVGIATSSGTTYAFLERGTVFYDLNTLINHLTGWSLGEARDINNSGQIVGAGMLNGKQRAFLLTPKKQLEPVSIPKPTATPPLASFPGPATLYRDLPGFLNVHGPSFSIDTRTAMSTPNLIDPVTWKEVAASYAGFLGHLGDAQGLLSAASSGVQWKAELELAIQQADNLNVDRASGLFGSALAYAEGGPVAGLLAFNAYVWGTEVAHQLEIIAEDPPDANFTTIVRPEDVINLTQIVPRSADARLRDALVGQAESGLKALSYIKAAHASLDRYAGALQAGDAEHAGMQLAALLQYLNLYNDAAVDSAAAVAQTRNLLIEAEEPITPYDAAAVRAIQQDLAANGFDPLTRSALADMGLTLDEIEAIRLKVITLDADQVSGTQIDLMLQFSNGIDAAALPEPGALLSGGVMCMLLLCRGRRFRRQR